MFKTEMRHSKGEGEEEKEEKEERGLTQTNLCS
jgi:hypothetical protein